MNSTTNVMALFLAALILSFSLGMVSNANITITLNGSPIAAPDASDAPDDDAFSIGDGQPDMSDAPDDDVFSIGDGQPDTSDAPDDDVFSIGDGQPDVPAGLDTSNWVEYTNHVMGYTVRVPNQLNMLETQQVIEIYGLDHQDEDKNQIIDMRIWVGDGFILQLQYQEPTYESFEVEIAESPNYYDLIKDQFDGSGSSSNLRMLHQGELRDTHLGQMLEQAFTYDTISNGQPVDVTVLYYDYYYDADTEIIFYIEGYGDADVQSLRQIIEAMVSTFEHLPVNL